MVNIDISRYLSLPSSIIMSCVSVVMEASLQVYSFKIPVNQAMSPLAWIIRHWCSQVFSLGASGGGTHMKSHEKNLCFVWLCNKHFAHLKAYYFVWQ